MCRMQRPRSQTATPVACMPGGNYENTVPLVSWSSGGAVIKVKRSAALSPFYSNAHCAVRILLLAIENTLNLKIRTDADPHSVRTLYGKTQVSSMQFSVYGNFPDSYRKALNLLSFFLTEHECLSGMAHDCLNGMLDDLMII